MYCPNCRNIIAEQQKFCTYCGVPLTGMPSNPPTTLIGFSPRINDPAFDHYKKQSKNWSFMFAFILAVIALIGFPIYGNASGDIKWPDSLYYGAGIGGMFILIAIIQTIRRGTDKTWDGVVIDKKIARRNRQQGNDYTQYYTAYIVKVKKNSGRVKTHNWNDAPGLYDYYQIGDHVRHHKGLFYYEKYDKSHDAQIICAACMTFNDIQNDYCFRCKCPLLK